MKFYGRERELGALEAWWREKKSHLVVVYGKRRVGKTALTLRFAKDKPSVFHLAERLDPRAQLKKISQEVGVFFRDETISEYGFPDWEALFRYIAEKKRRMVFIVDEFPYLIESDPAIPSIFQKGWDLYLSHSPVFLILCGSSVGMMEKHTLVYGAPLYGRRSGQILVEPFSFSDFEHIFPKQSFEERLMIFTAVGGTITYLKNFLSKKRFWKVVEDTMLSREQFLYEEVDFLLREEFREPRNYFSILLAISLGKRKFSEIANATGFDKATLSAYLSVLQELFIIRKDIPVTEQIPEKSRKGLYGISDHFFEFWFRFVFRNRGLLEEGRLAETMKAIKIGIGELLARNYEEISVEWVRRNFPERYRYVGRWWDANAEIDAVGIHPETKEILFGECKWSSKPVGTNVFDDLKKKARAVEWNRDDRKESFILFSKSGFTEGMIRVAREEGVILVQGDQKIEG